MRDEHARLRQPLQLGFADAEFAENRDIMFALKCRRSDRRQLICGKPPWPARQPILSAASIRHELHSAPVVAPLGRGQLLDRADFAHCDLGLIELGIERRHIGECQHPRLNDLVECAEIQPPRGRTGKPRVIQQIHAAHRAQPGRKCPAADDAGRDGELLPLRSGEERTIGGAEHRGLRPNIVVGQIDMRAFIDRKQGRGHRDVDVLAQAGFLAAVQRREDRDHRLQSRIDVGVRQAVGARFSERAAIMANAVFGEAGFGLHRRRISHPAAPRTALAVARDRGVDQSRIAFGKGLVIETEETERSRPEIFHHDIGGIAELQRQLVGAGDIEIDADVALAGVLLGVIARHAVGRWKRKARNIRAWRLDLDDLGAEILKVEPPSPDVSRFAFPSTDGMSGYYAQQNAGKRNVSINLNIPGAYDLALKLCDTADIVVENFRAGTLGFFGLDYETLSKRNPRLIYASITGYGQGGPWRSRMAYAPAVQAEAGFTENSVRHYGSALTEPRTDS